MEGLFAMTNMEILFKQMVHKKALDGLKDEEEDMNELRDTILQIKDLEAELIGFKEENGFLNTDVAELSTKIELMDHEMEERK